jgi:hypothetical protein
MRDFIASELGHLTQNHIVVSSRSPRIYGVQFSSSVAGIRSGLVNTPVKKPSFIVHQEKSLTTYRLSCHQQDRAPEPDDVPPG